jgi:hypothetical protein
MYADPKRIRKNVYKVCLDDYESEVIDRIVRETGEQRQVVIRDLLLKAIERMQSDTEHA